MRTLEINPTTSSSLISTASTLTPSASHTLPNRSDQPPTEDPHSPEQHPFPHKHLIRRALPYPTLPYPTTRTLQTHSVPLPYRALRVSPKRGTRLYLRSRKDRITVLSHEVFRFSFSYSAPRIGGKQAWVGSERVCGVRRDGWDRKWEGATHSRGLRRA